VGCGAFGIGGLIVGVALTVWLGSMALSGSTGGGGGGSSPGSVSRTADSSVSALDSALADVGEGVPGLEPSGAALRAPDGLAATGSTVLRGTHLTPGPIQVTTCLASSTSASETAGCDESTTVDATVGGDGVLAVEVPIHRVIAVGDARYDCAARAGACVLFGHRADNPLDTGLTAALAFTSGLPPVEAVAPPG
jgi:hypothetical protein